LPHSMTGFGAAEGPAGGGRIRVEIRTVNHRHYNPAIKLPGDLATLEGEVRERLRKEFDRGHVSVSVRWTELPQRGSGLSVDLERAHAAVAALRMLKDSLALPGEIDLGLVVRQPEVLSTASAEETSPATWSEVEAVVVEAARECRTMRQREGRTLAAELHHRLAIRGDRHRGAGA